MDRPCVRKRLLEMKRLCARQTLEETDTCRGARMARSYIR
jgi:hypothetical protein